MTQSDKNSRSILDLTHEEARQYFLEQDSYCDFALPEYFQFEKLLQFVSGEIANSELSSLMCEDKNKRPRAYEDINHKILSNKDGKYAWRPLQLINPVIYVSLVHKITLEKNWEHIKKRFKKFSKNEYIECMSILRKSLTKQSNKAEQILSWWQEMEQHSIEMALNYSCLIHTDITDCYGAIYTHSVAWAMHGKNEARKNRKENDWIGNQIDNHLQDMSGGQTNGIPQGSTLMDFIAEMVLGYADSELEKRLKNDPAGVSDCKILRYRDDYRIFSNSEIESKRIMKHLTETMIELGFKLSVDKTSVAPNIIRGSIKPDKLYWMRQKQENKDLQKHLLIIHDLSMQFPNCGSLFKPMEIFYKKLHRFYNYGSKKKKKRISENVIPLISIVTDIAHKNPKVYPRSAAIISLLLNFVTDEKQRLTLLKKIIKRFQDIPNTGHLDIWLQRVALGIGCEIECKEKLCKLASTNSKNSDIWELSWLKKGLINKINKISIIDENVMAELKPFISPEEVELFKDEYDNHWWA